MNQTPSQPFSYSFTLTHSLKSFRFSRVESMARLPKGGSGRKKIQLKRIENEKERAVTLTKRYGGLFKKANELATLCGVQIAIIVFSLSGKPLSFGSPGVHFIINKFLNLNQADQQPDDFITRFKKSYNESRLQNLNQELDELNEQLANAKKRGQMLKERLKATLGCETYEEYIGTLGIHGLMQLRSKLDEMNERIKHNDDEIIGASSSNDEAEVDLSKIGAPEDYLKL
ncbi:unnamed protein product [Lactuca saligna]|uniref:MADS-box domain-containing protein n=1 Tax=Lactuca saligna TaxID=75948 RepID=A0AA35YBR2_LACSI|nr:unnamed protein product [Lactuca saligna]